MIKLLWWYLGIINDVIESIEISNGKLKEACENIMQKDKENRKFKCKIKWVEMNRES